jgi:flavodoxin
MKRAILLVLTFAVLLSMSACGNAEQKAPAEAEQTPAPAVPELGTEPSSTEPPVPEPTEEVSSPEDQGRSNVLVVYFSRTGEQYHVGVIEKGNTAIVAEMIIEATGADSFEILPADDHYPITYKELTDVGLQEQRDGARPAIAGDLPDMSGYDTIFIGAPVWWGDWPMILYTFFENEPMSGKTLIPFSTHAGSGLSGFDTKLARIYPDCTIGKGLATAGTDTQNNPEKVRTSVDSWLQSLGF